MTLREAPAIAGDDSVLRLYRVSQLARAARDLAERCAAFRIEHPELLNSPQDQRLMDACIAAHRAWLNACETYFENNAERLH